MHVYLQVHLNISKHHTLMNAEFPTHQRRNFMMFMGLAKLLLPDYHESFVRSKYSTNTDEDSRYKVQFI